MSLTKYSPFNFRTLSNLVIFPLNKADLKILKLCKNRNKTIEEQPNDVEIPANGTRLDDVILKPLGLETKSNPLETHDRRPDMINLEDEEIETTSLCSFLKDESLNECEDEIEEERSISVKEILYLLRK
jgi:hypothetical protein